MLGLGALRRLVEDHLAHAVGAVIARGAPTPHQRPGAAEIDRNLAAATGHLDRVQGILDLQVEGDIAVADGDRLELRARMAQAQQQRKTVVAGGIGIDDQADGHGFVVCSRKVKPIVRAW